MASCPKVGLHTYIPVLRTGYAVMVEGSTCLHGRVHYVCCIVVGTLSWPWMSVGRLQDTALVRCDLCFNGGGVLAAVCGASDGWCTGLSCCSLAVWVWRTWFVGGFECAVVFFVLGDAGPLLLSPCHTHAYILHRMGVKSVAGVAGAKGCAAVVCRAETQRRAQSCSDMIESQHELMMKPHCRF